MRVLVFGGSGFIGSRILAVFAAQHHAFGTYFTNIVQLPGCSFESCDVRNRDAVIGLVKRIEPDIVVQVCGTKNIEFCAANPQDARRVHVTGTEHVVEACQQYGARLVFVSTDCVFDGQKFSYTEQDLTHPFNQYGYVKREGEQIVLTSGLDVIVIRASVLFGWRQRGQASNFALLVLKALMAGCPFSAATNLFNTPLEIEPGADAIARLALGQYRGIFHVAGCDRISRYGFALRVAKFFGLDASLVLPMEDTSGLRQPNSCLSVAHTEAALQVRFEGLDDGLVRMVSHRPEVIH